jgi:Uncharacterized protein conserved in bacteria
VKIIISPAKKMNTNTDLLQVRGFPVFLDKTEELKRRMQKLSLEEAMSLWKCSRKLAELNYKRFRHMDLRKNLTPSIISYEGIQYQYMAPSVMEEKQYDYLQEHLRILSGFYGILSPFDGVVPYRLEMQAKMELNGKRDLYGFWDESVYRELTARDHVVLNLASKEYSKVVEPYLQKDDVFVTCIFGELLNGKIIQKGTMAKMARGEMVNFLSATGADALEDAKKFDRLGYRYREELSSGTEYVFIKDKTKENEN